MVMTNRVLPGSVITPEASLAMQTEPEAGISKYELLGVRNDLVTLYNLAGISDFRPVATWRDPHVDGVAHFGYAPLLDNGLHVSQLTIELANVAKPSLTAKCINRDQTPQGYTEKWGLYTLGPDNLNPEQLNLEEYEHNFINGHREAETSRKVERTVKYVPAEYLALQAIVGHLFWIREVGRGRQN